MIASNLKPSIIYKEKLHRPRLASNNDKLEKNSDKLLENLDKINVNMNSSLSDAISNIQDILEEQSKVIKSVSDKQIVSIQDITADIEKYMLTINMSLQNICSRLDSLSKIPEQIDLILSKLAEFDVVQDDTKSITNNNEIDENFTSHEVNETEEIPKDWISDDDEEDSNNLDNPNESDDGD